MNTLFWVSYGLLWVLALTLTFGLFALYHIHGKSIALDVERKGGWGPKLGAAISPIELNIDSTRSILVGRAREGIQLLYFMAPKCSRCQTLLPMFAEAARVNEDVQFVIIMGGVDLVPSDIKASLPAHAAIITDKDWKAGQTWDVRHAPYVVVVDRAGKVLSVGKPSPNRTFEQMVRTAISAQRELVPA